MSFFHIAIVSVALCVVCSGVSAFAPLDQRKILHRFQQPSRMTSTSNTCLSISRGGDGATAATAFALDQRTTIFRRFKHPSRTGLHAAIRGGDDVADTQLFELPTITAAFTSKDAPLNGSMGEIVGSTGRIGSFLLRSGNGLLAAVPRGLSPGSLSTQGTAIFVAVDSSAVSEVIRTTIPNRRKDLVFVTNGLPSRIFSAFDEELTSELTISVPHFGVLAVGGDVVTSPSSPPTVVHGRQSSALASLLQPRGIAVNHVDSFAEIEAAVVKKLMWSSLMWLLCHEDDFGPINVAAVHEKKEGKLRSLVQELLPSANAIAGRNVGSVDDIMQYMESYSLSMPNAIPSKDHAMNELPLRHGIFLRADESNAQPLHEELLKRVAGPDSVDRCRSTQPEVESKSINRVLTHIACPSMAFIARDNEKKPTHPVRSAIVVGAGMIGSSVALALARHDVDVTVLDKRNIEDGDIGEATTASWAWLNANDKSPFSYFSLTNIGMTVWRNDPLLAKLPVWCGSLVRREITAGSSSPGKGGAYCSIGPLERRQVLQLEPNAEFSGESKYEEEISFFPDEGHVDPVEASRTLRQGASAHDVHFRGNTHVVNTIEKEGKVHGVILDDGSSLEADIVVIAAGVGSSSETLGGLEITRQPGTIVFAEEKSDSTLHRILVDTINESHILRRKEGQLVIGGGYLQVGGLGSASQLGGGASQDSDAGKELLAAASRVAPTTIQGATLSGTKEGDIPIPGDGFPAVGFNRSGMYVIVTHSGITLGPLLGELAALEICSQSRCRLLDDYRPSRFQSE